MMERTVSRRRLLGAALTAGVAGAGVRGASSGAVATQEATGGWPMYNFDAANSGHDPAGTGPRADIDRKWTFETDVEVETESSAVVADGAVYLGNHQGTLHALTVDEGRPIWTFETEANVLGSPAVVDGTVYIGDMQAVYAVSAADGSEQWVAEIGAGPTWSPAVLDGVVYVSSFEERVAAFDASDGTELWVAETDTEIFSAPTVTGNAVYVTMMDGTVSALDASDGRRRWSAGTSEQAPSSPAVADGSVYVASDNGTLYVLDAGDGSEQWTFETDGPILGTPGVAGDSVYVGSHDRTLYALDAAGGGERWSFEAESELTSSPVVVDGMVYAGTRDGAVYGLETADGTERWSVQTDDSIPPFTSLAVTGDSIYVPTDSGVFHAFTGTAGDPATVTATPTVTPSDDPTTANTRTAPPVNDLSGANQYGPLSYFRGQPALSLLAGGGILAVGMVSAWKILASDGAEPTTTRTESSVEDIWKEAESALSSAAEAASDGEYVQALDAYDRGIRGGERALETIPDDDESRVEIAAVLERAREKRESIQQAHTKQTDLMETLETAETHFQTAIAAPSSDRVVIPRERYRQARNAYEDALDMLEDLDGDVLENGVTVSPEPTVGPPPENLGEFPGVHPEAQALLEEAELTTLTAVRDADSDTLTALRDENVIGEQLGVRLVALNRWHAGEAVEFTALEEIEDRHRLADEAYQAHRR